MHDYKARYYDPTIGRFISADTIIPGTSGSSVGPNSEERLTPLTVGFHETMFLGQANQENKQFLSFGPSILWNRDQIREYHVPNGPMNPQMLSRYSYVTNNPLKYNDPTGHSSSIVAQAQYTIAELRDMIIDMKNLSFAAVAGGTVEALILSFLALLVSGPIGIILIGIGLLIAGLTAVDLGLQIDAFVDYLEYVLQEAIKVAEQQANELGLEGEAREEFIEGFVITIFMAKDWLPFTWKIWTSVTPTRLFIIAGFAGEALRLGFQERGSNQGLLILPN